MFLSCISHIYTDSHTLPGRVHELEDGSIGRHSAGIRSGQKVQLSYKSTNITELSI